MFARRFGAASRVEELGASRAFRAQHRDMKGMRNTGMGSRNDAEITRSRYSLRTLLLAAVNLPLALILAVLLPYEYQREMAERVAQKQVALEEEAKTLLPALVQLREQGAADTQEFIDTVCGSMTTRLSPGHHIAVRLPETILQAQSHGRASPEMMVTLASAANAPNHRASLGDTELVVGEARGRGITVYVAEALANVETAMRAAALRRAASLIAVFFVTAALLNALLMRAVTNPIERLVATLKRIGAGEFGAQPETLHSVELSYLARELGAMSQALAAADRRHRAQMAKAREIQRRLLPAEAPRDSLLTARLFEPAEDVGGDFYDALPLGGGEWLFCVADVAGHGVPAAMSAAILKMLLLHAQPAGVSPREVLEHVNRRLVAVTLPEDFVSMILLRVDPAMGRAQYASAGHEPCWLIASQQDPQELAATGTLLGIDESMNWEEVTLSIRPGDVFALVSDGLSETFDTRGEAFGRARLVNALAACRGHTVEESVSRIRAELEKHRGEAPQGDDLTAVLIQLGPRAAQASANRAR